MSGKNYFAYTFLIFLLSGVILLSNSCMNRKRCPGVHKYTTPQKAGTAKHHHSSAHFGGASMKDHRMGGRGPRYSGGIMRDSRVSSLGRGTGAWTKKNKNKDKRKAVSGIIPKNLKAPPKAKAKKSNKKKNTKEKALSH